MAQSTFDRLEHLFSYAVSFDFWPACRTIDLALLTQQKANTFYQIMKGYFGEKPLVLRIYRHGTKANLIITCRDEFIAAYDLQLPRFKEASLDHFVMNEAVQQRLKLRITYRSQTGCFTITRLGEIEKRADLNIIRWELHE